LGERASNLFGVLLSLTFFSVLLAVMLVAVSILPDGPTQAPRTLRSEARSGPVRTPQPVTLGELGLAQAPALVPVGAGLGSVVFTTEETAPPAGPSGPGGVIVPGPGGPTRGPGFGPGSAPTEPSRVGDGKDRALEKAKSRAERAKDRSERAAEKAKNRAEKVREKGKERSGDGRGGEAVRATKPKPSHGNGEGPPRGKGRGKGKKH
jgi:hypothetical protein